MLGKTDDKRGASGMALAKSTLAVLAAILRARHRRRKARCRPGSPPACRNSAASSIRRRPPRSTRRCSKRTLPGRQDRARRQIRRCRSQPARCLLAGDGCIGAAGVDFVHGGAFTAGNKRGPNASPFYDNIMLWAVKNGFVGVNTTYRLAPQSPWPAAAEDLAAAVKWVAENAASRGGDPPAFT